MTTGLIYKITNPSGNHYIGRTFDWKQRYRRYKCLRCKNQKALYASFLKYGFENHWFEIILNDIKEDLLNIFEQIFIWLYDSFNNGLNLTFGGEGFLSGKRNPMHGKSPPNKGTKASPELRLKLSLAHKGFKISDEQKKKQSERMKGKNTWMKGKKMTKESSDKKSAAMKKYWKRKKYEQVSD